MTVMEPATSTQTHQQLSLALQYTVEAYKAFQKLAETLPNPMTMEMFRQFAVDERGNRDLIEIKIASTQQKAAHVTLGPDMAFLSTLVEGELSYREATEFLIARERTMQKKLREAVTGASANDRNVLIYLESLKRSHIVELERELELIRHDPDWWKREDAEWRIVNGSPNA